MRTAVPRFSPDHPPSAPAVQAARPGPRRQAGRKRLAAGTAAPAEGGPRGPTATRRPSGRPWPPETGATPEPLALRRPLVRDGGDEPRGPPMPADLPRPTSRSKPRGRCRSAASTRSAAGRWAGPVVAAAVILDPAAIPDGLDDSKRLTARPARGAARRARGCAAIVGVGQASVEEIADDEHPAGELPRHAPGGRRPRPPPGAGARRRPPAAARPRAARRRADRRRRRRWRCRSPPPRSSPRSPATG